MDVSQNEVPEDPPLLKAAQDHVLVDLSRGREIEDPSRGHVFEDPLQYCEIEEQMTSPGSKLSTRKQDTLYSYKKNRNWNNAKEDILVKSCKGNK